MAGTLAFSSVGSKVYISAGVPATIDGTGFAALTYTEISEVTDIGVLGGDTAILNHNPVAINTVFKLKGTKEPGQLSLKAAYAPTDPGQILLKAAEASTAPYAIKVTLQGGAQTFYSQALITAFKIGVGTQSQITNLESTAALSGVLVTV